MKRSFIREILESTTEQTISFAGGLPDQSLFPHIALKESAMRVLEQQSSLQYTVSTGVESLRQRIAQRYCDDGFATKVSEILITSGSQQALDIIARYHRGSGVTVEAPSYLGAMNLFELNKLDMEPIELWSDGIDIESFAQSFSRTELAYIIPDYQNPTGYSYSLAHREQIAHIVEQSGGVLIEDSPYTEIYFESKLPSISSQIPQHSYHLGSFSKSLAPALRVGWIRADEALLQPLIAYKEAMDLHTNGLAQHILDDYLSHAEQYDDHLMTLRSAYATKMQIFMGYLDDILPEFEYTRPKGGMFIYGELEGMDTSALVRRCLERGVVFVPGAEFYVDGRGSGEIRFNFTHCRVADISRGLHIIKDIINSSV